MKRSNGVEDVVTIKQFQRFYDFFFCGCEGAKLEKQADKTIKVVNAITHQPVVLIPA
jgi:hypothetical protein